MPGLSFPRISYTLEVTSDNGGVCLPPPPESQQPIIVIIHIHNCNVQYCISKSYNITIAILFSEIAVKEHIIQYSTGIVLHWNM